MTFQQACEKAARIARKTESFRYVFLEDAKIGFKVPILSLVSALMETPPDSPCQPLGNGRLQRVIKPESKA
jgi:hypothetical protein